MSEASTAPAPESVALAIAVRALDDPLYPTLGQRCPRCGERLPRPASQGAKLPEGMGVLGTNVSKTHATHCPRCKVELRSAAAAANIVPTRNGFFEFLRGIAYVPRGYLRILRSPRLWAYAIVPFFLNIAALVLGGYLALKIVSPWLQGLQTEWAAEGGVWAYAQYLLVAADWIFTILVFPAIAFLIVCPPFSIAYKLIFMPAMEIMTEATERIVLGFEVEGGFNLVTFLGNLLISVVDAILLTIVQVLVLLVLLPFNLIPVVGNIFWAIVMPAAFAGMDYTDINLVRRDYTTREKLRLWRTYQWRFFGFGLAFFVFITVPILNAFVIPAAATGGALLYLELERK